MPPCAAPLLTLLPEAGAGRTPEVPGAPTSRLSLLSASAAPKRPLVVLQGVSVGGVRIVCRLHAPSLNTASGKAVRWEEAEVAVAVAVAAVKTKV
jgi:hypothetical protein